LHVLQLFPAQLEQPDAPEAGVKPALLLKLTDDISFSMLLL